MVFTWFRMIHQTLCCDLEHEEIINLHPVASDNDSFDIICPAYNPKEECLENLKLNIENIRAHYPNREINLIISDDGSTKNFDEELLSSINNCKIIHTPHKGKGSAVRAGIAESTSKYAIYTDIDMPYTLQSIFSVVDNLLSGYDLIIATRNYDYYKNLNLSRKIMSLGSKFMNKLLLGIDNSDAQGGLKALSVSAKEQMLKTQINEFLFDTEFVKLSTKNNLLIKSVDVNLNEGIHMSNMPIKILLKEVKNFFIIMLKR